MRVLVVPEQARIVQRMRDQGLGHERYLQARSPVRALCRGVSLGQPVMGGLTPSRASETPGMPALITEPLH